jgi:3-oxosteroid 1-dehydrogenase
MRGDAREHGGLQNPNDALEGDLASMSDNGGTEGGSAGTEENRFSVSRRKFIAGAAGAFVAGVAAGTALGSLGIPAVTGGGASWRTATTKMTTTTARTQPYSPNLILDIPSHWDYSADVVVVGAGGAGLSAALGALESGASVLILEKGKAVGGTTALSVSGGLWVPNNSIAAAAGQVEDVSQLMEYCNNCGEGQQDPGLMIVYFQQAPGWVDHLMHVTGLTFSLETQWGDYYNVPGGQGAVHWIGAKGGGPGLVAALKSAVDIKRATTMLSTAATSLYKDATGRIVGLRASPVEDAATTETVVATSSSSSLSLPPPLPSKQESSASGASSSSPSSSYSFSSSPTISIQANKGVILCAAGMDWNKDMLLNYMRGPIDTSSAPQTITGDGILMAMAAGAWMHNMNNAWGWPTYITPNGNVSDVPQYRGKPGAIVVNRRGKRFADESSAYPVFNRAFHVWDTGVFDYINHPAYVIMDSDCFNRYGLAGTPPGSSQVPGYISTASTLQGLASALNIDPSGLQEAVAQFNRYAAEGVDPDFNRGLWSFDQNTGGDPSRTELKNDCLAPLQIPPYYGIEIHPGLLGTCGGPRINTSGQILDQAGVPIPGLYGAGNDVANAFGAAYPSGGATLGPATFFGWTAGKAAAGSA